MADQMCFMTIELSWQLLTCRRCLSSAAILVPCMSVVMTSVLVEVRAHSLESKQELWYFWVVQTESPSAKASTSVLSGHKCQWQSVAQLWHERWSQHAEVSTRSVGRVSPGASSGGGCSGLNTLLAGPLCPLEKSHCSTQAGRGPQMWRAYCHCSTSGMETTLMFVLAVQHSVEAYLRQVGCEAVQGQLYFFGGFKSGRGKLPHRGLQVQLATAGLSTRATVGAAKRSAQQQGPTRQNMSGRLPACR